MKRAIGFFLFALVASSMVFAQQGSGASSADDNAALQQKIRDLEDRLIALEGQVRTLKAQSGAAQSGPATAAAPAPSSAEAPVSAPAESVASAPGSLGGAGGSAAKALNPDISMIGDFV